MPNRPKVFISRTIPAEPLARIEAECEVTMWPHDTPPSVAELHAAVANVDGLMSMLTERIDAALLDAAPNLKVISQFAVGIDNINVAAATARQLPVGNTPGVLTEATADQAFALLLAAARRLVEGVEYVRNDDWQTWYPLQLLGSTVSGATLGIIGLGRIGHAMAQRAKGFGMRILYHGGSNQDFAADVGAEQVSLDTLLSESDFVSLHCPLTPQTKHIINAAALSRMKPSAILINTARGGVVDSAALLHALQTHQIRYAALDVTDPEPIAADHPLVHLPNCIVVPHLGSATWQTRTAMGMLAADNLLAGLRGERLPNCVNPEVYG